MGQIKFVTSAILWLIDSSPCGCEMMKQKTEYDFIENENH